MKHIDELNSLYENSVDSLNNIESISELLKLKSECLGKKSQFNEILKTLKDLSPELRKEVGAKTQEIKSQITELIIKKQSVLETEQINKKLSSDLIDLTYKKRTKYNSILGGGYHPCTKFIRKVEDVFISMGFNILSGPAVETEKYNFDALNIPELHPARDMHDTFWFSDPKYLLRTHTSPVQIRAMEKFKPPFRFVVPGKVFRAERTDASHEFAFHQLEGMVIGKDINIGNLIFCIESFLSKLFEFDINIRIRPSYFPFVEPGIEFDMSCLICKAKGCSVCSNTGWLEVGGAGIVHPKVLEYSGIDYNEYSGFAFGLGIDRLIMLKFGIEDIRHLHSGNLKFISQFREF